MKFEQRVTGQDRKVIASVIAEVLNEPVKYAGVPSFVYEVGGWLVDKKNLLRSPDLPVEDLQTIKTVYDALKAAGASAEGNALVSLSAEGHTETTLSNLENLITSKAPLIKKALGINELLVTKNEEWLIFPFYNATINADEILAYITFSIKLSEQAKTLKRAYAKEKEAGNEKYAFRCFLLRLGFIGNEYKAARKILLAGLSGNSAFKNGAPNGAEVTSDEQISL